MAEPISPYQVYSLAQALRATGLTEDELNRVLEAAGLQWVDTGAQAVILGEVLLQAFRLAAARHAGLEIRAGAVYSLETVARLLGVSLSTVYRLQRQGALRVARLGGRTLVLGQAVLDCLQATQVRDGKVKRRTHEKDLD